MNIIKKIKNKIDNKLSEKEQMEAIKKEARIEAMSEIKNELKNEYKKQIIESEKKKMAVGNKSMMEKLAEGFGAKKEGGINSDDKISKILGNKNANTNSSFALNTDDKIARILGKRDVNKTENNNLLETMGKTGDNTNNENLKKLVGDKTEKEKTEEKIRNWLK